MAQFEGEVVGLDVMGQVSKARPLMRFVHLKAGDVSYGHLGRLVVVELVFKLHDSLFIIFIGFGRLFTIIDNNTCVFMASDLVSKRSTLVNVVNNVLFHRLAEGHAILLARTFLLHVETFDKLAVIVLLALSCRGT